MIAPQTILNIFTKTFSRLSNVGVEETDSESVKESKNRLNYSIYFLLVCIFIFHLYSYQQSFFAAFALAIYATYFFNITSLILQFFGYHKIAFNFYFTSGLFVLFVLSGQWGPESMVQLFMLGVCLELILHFRENVKMRIISIFVVVGTFLWVSIFDIGPFFELIHIPQHKLEGDILVHIKRYSSISAVLFVINVSFGFIRKIQAKNEVLNEQISLLQKLNNELADSQKMQKIIFDNSADSQTLFLVEDNHFKAVDCNEQTLVMFECPNKEAYLNNILFYRCDEYAEAKKEKMMKHLETHDFYADEMIFQTYNKRKFWVKRWVKKLTLADKSYLLGGVEDISQEKEAANKVVRSESRLISVVNSTTDSVWAVNLDLEIQYFNAAFETSYTKYWHKAPEIGMSAIAIFQNLHISIETQQPIDWQSAFEQVLKGECKTFDVYIVYPDRKVYLSHTLNPIIEKKTGEIIGCTAWSKDITDITLKMMEVAEKNQLIEMILSTIPDMLYIYDIQENRGIYSNNRQADALGYLQDEINTPNFIIDKVIYPEDKHLIIENWERIKTLKDNEVTLIEHRAIHKDGSIRWFSSKEKVFLRSEDGKVKQYIGLTQDISDIKKTEARILRNEHQLDMAQEIGKFGSFVYEMKNGVFKTTRQLKQLLDLEDDITIEEYFQRIHRKDQRAHHVAVMQLVKKGKPINITVRYVHKNGSIAYFKVRANAFYGSDKQIEQIIGTLQEITEHKRIEQELIKQNIALEKVNTELDKFVYSTAHDLRAPVSSALGLVQLMATQDNGPVMERYVDLQRRCLEKLDVFICDIILFSYNSRLKITYEEIDFNTIINKALGDIKYNAKTEKVQKEIEISANIPFISDASRLKIILQHALSNGFRFADMNKPVCTLKISVLITKENAIISITDNGIGIDNSILGKVFDMFYKGTIHSDGSGIGLYIVKDTVSKLGGNVEIHSVLQEGTTLTITLPNHVDEK